MRLLDAVVLRDICWRRSLFLYDGVELCLFLGGQIVVLRHQLVDTLGHLRPGHQNIPTLGFSEPYPFAAVIFIRMEVVRECGVSAAGAIEVFQKDGLFFCRMRL